MVIRTQLARAMMAAILSVLAASNAASGESPSPSPAPHPGFFDNNRDIIVGLGTGLAAILLAYFTKVYWTPLWRKVTAGPKFEVEPIQGPGQNKCSKIRHEDSRNPADPEHFRVSLSMRLWTRDEVALDNAELTCEWPGTSPELQRATVGGENVEFSGNYRFLRSLRLPAGQSTEILIIRDFTTARPITNETDYQRVQLHLELSTPSGRRNVVVNGKLEPGGRIDDVKVRVRHHGHH